MVDLNDLIQQLIDALDARTDDASAKLRAQLLAIQGDVRGDVNVAAGDIIAGDKISDDKVVRIVESLQETIHQAPPGMQVTIERMANYLDHHTRRDYGDRLNALGDPRPGVGVLTEVVSRDVSASMAPMLQGAQAENAPTFEEVRLWGNRPEHIGLPDIVFVKLSPAGQPINPPAEPWTMVDDKGKEYGPFPLKPFYLAKYPVTNAQFEVFATAEDGFQAGHWYEGLADQYDKLKDPNRDTPNHPRETINWYDCIAFCRWLNHRLGWPDIPFDLTPDTLHTYNGLRLPTEWEWQFAAQNGDKANTYPWGPEWDGRKANTDESGLSRTTAVGMYPPAPCGAFDLCGNVYDWCLNEYGDLSLDLTTSGSRVVRGGSWRFNRVIATVGYRFRGTPLYRLDDWGCRLAVCAPPSQ